ncbi:MAG: glycosyl hydrolase [Pseudomonadota bacterium]
MMALRFLLLSSLLLVLPTTTSLADTALLEGLQWREVGPYRGGRSAAVAGIPQDRETYYFGATGGGVWKTTNGGGHWENVSDGFFGGSIGAVAVSAWDPSVLYVGGGEKTIRGNVSHGDGIWKSVDAGKTWAFAGLPDSRHIARIRIHPRNPDLVYVAAMGHLFGPNEERGVYRSRDGGESWERVLFVNDQAGAVDLVMDPTNPRVLYATTWRVKRTPYSLESGGEGSDIWKTTDGGDSWTRLSENDGLPEPPLGIAGITVSPSNPDNLYAIIEAAEGGVFRSRDGGESWARVNQERKLRQRAWYYTRINADPLNEEVVYVSNVRFHRSADGGRTFEAIATPHVDNHDLWIDPTDPQRMVQANDGGANVSFDGGASWSTQANQPTAQMYRVSTDNAFPFRLLGGQQDNSTVRIHSRSARGSRISTRDWEPTAGGESGHVVAHPDNPDIVYGGSYGGYLVRMDHGTGDRRIINVWPDNPMGWGAAELKYRFNWNFPIFFSPHDADTLYAAGNVLFRSRDEGQTWEAVSPDLTRNIKEKQQSSGGPITQDNTSVEYYGTLFAVAESPLQEGLIWAGSDDGRLHLTRNGGESWDDVTPRGLPEEIQINSVEPHPTEPGGLYLAATAYKNDDFRPWLFRTDDFGRSWDRIDDGIPRDHFTRALRADPDAPGVLYAGTERGVHVSFNDGKDWQSLQLDLPIVPITDLAVKEGALVAATQGRGYWILDHLALVRQAPQLADGTGPGLYASAPNWRVSNDAAEEPGHAGTHPAVGVTFFYHFETAPAPELSMSLEIRDTEGQLVRRFTRLPEEGEAQDPETAFADDDRLLPAEAGLNQFVWDLKYPSVERFDGLVLWNRSLDGPRALPGAYTVILTVGEQESRVETAVLADPRATASLEELIAQFNFVWGANRKLTEAHQAIRDLRNTRAQINAVATRVGDDPAYAALIESGDALKETLERVETTLYQTQLESPQDPLNFPIRLNDKLAGVMGLVAFGDHPPTASAIAVRDELVTAIDEALAELNQALGPELEAYNTLADEIGLPAVLAPREG